MTVRLTPERLEEIGAALDLWPEAHGREIVRDLLHDLRLVVAQRDAAARSAQNLIDALSVSGKFTRQDWIVVRERVAELRAALRDTSEARQ